MVSQKKTKDKKIPKSIEAYMPLVHSIASMVSGRGLPPNIQYDDLVSDGTIGLMKAWKNFDPNRGVKFETYSSYRIRGEILDGLKHYSPVPYRVQVKIRDLAKIGFKAAVKEKLQREEKELEKKQLSEAEFDKAVTKIKKIISASALMYLMSLDDLASVTEVKVAGEKGPADELEFKDLKKRLDMAIEKLPELQRRAVALFFHKGLNQRQIAAQEKLSRPKVCRLIDRAVRTLQQELKNV